MAKLNGVVKGNWEMKKDENFNSWLSRQDKLLSEIRKEGKLIQFPVADGYAFYRVDSEKPLTLSFVPYMDAYQIPDAHLRGLNLDDVKQLLNRRKTPPMFG